MDSEYSLQLTSRQWFFMSLVGVILILLASWYFQFFAGYDPCPLCEMQRLTFIAIAIVLAIAILKNPRVKSIRLYSVIVFILAAFGVALASRQVWLQNLPANEVPACGPNLNFIFRHLPPEDMIRQIFYGSADCAKVDWRFLHLSFAAWAIVFFSFLAIIAIWQFIVPTVRVSSSR